VTTTNYRPGTKVRFFSMVGPCLPATVVRSNPTTYTVDFYGTKKRVHRGWVHADPCVSCTDHPNTQYPYGYQD
jgi:hypothetical protein